MVSKLNLRIKEMYGQTKKVGSEVEKAASSIKEDLDEKVISVQKSKMPFVSKSKTRINEFIKNHKTDLKYLLLIIPIVASFIIAREIQRRQDFHSRAGVHTASVSFQLENWTLPPESSFDVWVNADSPVSFVNATISFDPNSVNLTHEVTTTGILTRIVKVTPMAEANSTGSVSVVLALDPSMASNPPTGTFQVASLTFNANTPNPNVSTVISFDTSLTQLVANDQSVFQLTSTNLNLVLNPTATPTPTPTSTPNDTTPPEVTINSPADGSAVPDKGSFAIKTTASDASGISKIIIAIDGTASKTCSNSTSCQVNVAVAKLSAGSHTITSTATDKSPNANTATSTIQVTK